jgi:hypothetical protein
MTATRIWRWRRAYAYLSEHGEDPSRALLRDLNVLERSLQRDLADLGVSPRAAAELGVNLARLAAARTSQASTGTRSTPASAERCPPCSRKARPMFDERIRRARRAEQMAFVDAHATENELVELALSACAGAHMKFGFALTDLVRIADSDGDEEGPPLEYDPAALAEVTARIATRQELRLPRRECVVRKPPAEASYCLCLSEAIEAAVASGEPMTRDEVVKAARQAHSETWAWLKRKPKPRPVRPAHAPLRETPKPRPAPVPASTAAVTDTNTRPARVIKRSPKWFDPHSRSVRDMQF